MRYIHSEETLEVPENGTCANSSPVCRPRDEERTAAAVTRDRRPTPTKSAEEGRKQALGRIRGEEIRVVSIKSRLVTVEGPRGKLSKDLSHIAVSFSLTKKGLIGIEIHHGVRKNVAALRTVRTLINNLIIGVTKGFKYKMRYVYAHFPINVNLDQNAETGNWEVEIRNFIGEKIVRRVVMQPGVEVEISKTQKDELVLSGNSLEGVSQSAADIQQICRVRNKDIRKFLDGLYVSEKGNVVEE
ncbi:ribosomal protein L6, alpha-beta domain-containing protein [Parachaetomium inaequale]|uniref:Ribosomal protein L6, alpha-beta domain-containing protein n=1 Tax=Parachaetomium inaequale TaxID=2588326 RepID=A0AAN6STZ8_9PEZI|nr:ribosomal protein L6, alpha-beta domain-containing protein [Parachaetomium inaequale]